MCPCPYVALLYHLPYIIHIGVNDPCVVPGMELWWEIAPQILPHCVFGNFGKIGTDPIFSGSTRVPS